MKHYLKNKQKFTKLVYSAFGLTFLLFSCSENPEDGMDGTDGTNGLNSLIITSVESPGNNCANGGILMQTGLDTNQNGTLESTEVNSTSFVCNGIDEFQNLISVIQESPGSNCANGGQNIRIGLDTNNNGILDESEINNSMFVCNGTDGITSLINSTNEASGVNCLNGGLKIEFGLDANRNASLEATEVTSTSYVCNGVIESQDQAIIENIITDDIQNALDEFGVIIPMGINPPSLEGTFFSNSLILKNSNIPSDVVGRSFTDFTFQIKNQNSTDLTATIFTEEGSQTGSGEGGFIVGSDNKFAILFENLSEDSSTNGKILTVNIYLGELGENGIANFERILVVKDDFGDPTDQYIEIGEGRHIEEQDGFSEKIDDDISSKSNNIKMKVPSLVFTHPF